MKLRTQITLALLVAAVAAPAAHAGSSGTTPNHRASTLAATSWATPDLVERYVLTHAKTSTVGTRPNDRAGAIGPAAGSAAPDRVERYVLTHTKISTVGTRPNDRAGAIGPTAGSAMPDLVERYGHSPQPLVPSTTKNSAGFDWADAGIGAGGMLAIMLLVSIAALAARQGRRRLASV